MRNRIARLAERLGSHHGYASGAQPFPEKVSDEDAVDLAAALADEFDRGATRRAELAREAGLSISCRTGCNNCCTVLVMVYRPEALRIARYLQKEENADAAAAFLSAYPGWREQVGDMPERLTDLFVHGTSAAYDQLHMEAWRRRAMCAFNHEGRCSIYPVRPLGCRNALALDTDENCVADSPRPAAAVSFVPLDEFLKGATRVLQAAHNAGKAQRRHGQQAVCAAVHELLAARDPG